MNGMMNGSMMFGMLLWILFVIGLIIMTIYVVIRVLRKNREKEDHETAGKSTSGQRILDERYAKGEMTEKEYRRKKMMIEETDSK